MQRTTYSNEPAYVVHRRNYQESSALVDLLTRSYGRVSVVARGRRRPKSSLGGSIQPFQRIRVSWTARSELGTLTDAEMADAPARLSSNDQFVAGAYMNELVIRLVERFDGDASLFDAYDHAIAGLRMQQPIEVTLRRFEKHLLDVLGYGLQLEHDAESGADINPTALYVYRPDVGPIEVSHDGQMTAREEIGILIHGETLRALAEERLESVTQLREAKRLMRAVLAPQLGSKPLRTRELFDATRRMSKHRTAK
jgi:DNA repair protein RecO (recombination protein O)